MPGAFLFLHQFKVVNARINIRLISYVVTANLRSLHTKNKMPRSDPTGNIFVRLWSIDAAEAFKNTIERSYEEERRNSGIGIHGR